LTKRGRRAVTEQPGYKGFLNFYAEKRREEARGGKATRGGEDPEVKEQEPSQERPRGTPQLLEKRGRIEGIAQRGVIFLKSCQGRHC